MSEVKKKKTYTEEERKLIRMKIVEQQWSQNPNNYRSLQK